MRRIVALILVSAFALHTGPLFSAVVAAQGLGTVTGTAQNSTGQPLAKFTVRLRNVTTGQLVGSTTTDAAGTFLFEGLTPGTMVVLEMVNAAGEIVGTSAVISVTAGGTVTVTVTASAAATLTTGVAGGTAAGGGVNIALLLTTIAGVGGIVGYIVSENQSDASPSR